MSRIRTRQKINNDIEKLILTGTIVSTEFLHVFSTLYKAEYMKIDYSKIILKWVLNYYENYKKAPVENIEKIFKVEKEKLKKAQALLIEDCLLNISEDYEKQETFNYEYLLTKTRDYFEKRSLEILFEKGIAFVTSNQIEEAKKLLENQKKVIQKTSDIFNPFDPNEIKNFESYDNSNKLFRYSGKAGALLGDFERGWLVSFMGPEKRGKSWNLEEVVFQAIPHHLNVLVISLEMNKVQMKRRTYQRLTGLAQEKTKVTYPIFDCKKNQTNTCKLACRVNKEKKPREYTTRTKYKPCTVCRNDAPFKKTNFSPAIWFAKYTAKELNQKDIGKKAKHYVQMFGDRLRIKIFPAFGAISSDIRNVLDELEYTEGFIPDVIVIDYLDILGQEDKRLSERGNIDLLWKQFKNIAATRNCLVVTAEQSNKASRDRKTIKSSDTSEDKRKDAHIDMKIGINQTEKEKEQGVMRLNILLHRHKKNLESLQVLLLQSLDVGQPLLDSEIVTVKEVA